MLGNAPQLSLIAGARAAGDKNNLAAYLRAMTRAGYAMVLIKPDSKLPICPLTARTRVAADNAAKEAARLRGVGNWEKVSHDCGIHHALTTPEEVTKHLTNVEKIYGVDTINIGIEVGKSRLLVVDVDTDVEKQAFLTDWSRESGQDESYRTPTVLSPGVQKGEDWVHKNGGHYWFTIPDDVTLPDGRTGAYKSHSGWSAFWKDRQVLVPPSVRPEGPYKLVGEVLPAPEWLINRILTEAENRSNRARNKLESLSGDEIDSWSAKTPWEDILTPSGWSDTGTVDNCSCPIWTAPGNHSSPKSATAHDLGCARYDDSAGHGPLHLWTDNPPEYLHGCLNGKRTLTKLQYIAARDYAGNTSGAIKGLGISSRPRDDFSDVISPERFREAASVQELAMTSENGHKPEPDKPVREKTKFTFLSSEELESIPNPEPLVQGYLDKNTLARIVGKSGHGKTFICLDLACCVATGKDWWGQQVEQGLVIYMVAEGAQGYKKRLRAWENRYHGGQRIPASGLQVLPVPVQVSGAEWTDFIEAVTELHPKLIILDTQARITVGVDENSAEAMGIFIHRLEQLRASCDATVLAVHHVGHQGEHGRGSTAVYGALGSELRVAKEGPKIAVYTEKQKDMAFGDTKTFFLQPDDESESAVLVDHLEEDLLSVTTEINADSPTKDKIAAIVYGSFNHDVGGSKAEIWGLVRDNKLLPVKKTIFYKTWGLMVSAGELEMCPDPNTGKSTQRFRLARSEIRRLGLDK